MSLLKFAFGLGVDSAVSGLTPPKAKSLPKLETKSPPKINAHQDPSDPSALGAILQQTLNHTQKLGLDESKLCGTCKQSQHYGACKLPKLDSKPEGAPFIRTKMRTAAFNFEMYGGDNDSADELDIEHDHSKKTYQERLHQLLDPKATPVHEDTPINQDVNDTLRTFFNTSKATNDDTPITSSKILY